MSRNMIKMEYDNDNIYDLIAKSFTDGVTEKEQITLDNWKTASKSNLDEYNDFKDIWEHSHKFALPLKIDLPGSLKTTQKKAGISSAQIKWLPILKRVAAVVVFAVMLSALYKLFLVEKPKQAIESTVYQVVKATYGTKAQVELADGTIVQLNSGSRLRFPTSFNGLKNRNVELTGEGYFTVAKNSQQPFIVDVDKIEIKVLGTTFNIDAYSNNAAIAIALVEGKISLQKKTANGTTELMQMLPNQVAFYNESENKLLWKTDPELSKYTAWTNGKIVFSDDPVQTVVQKLENWYNVDIELADKTLERYRFTGTFIDEPLEQVLSILNLTSKMKYEIIPAQKLGDNSYTKRKIILKSK